MATREDLKTTPYTVYLPNELRKALDDEPATAIGRVPNKIEQEDAFGGIVIAGKGTPDYGSSRNQNFINLVANFASEEDPGNPGNPYSSLIPNPLEGQSWYDMTAGVLKVYSGASWVAAVSSIDSGSVTFDDSGLTYVTGANVQIALQNVDAELISLNSDLGAHLADPTDAHDAGAISVSPTVAGQSNVQDALVTINSTASSASSTITSHIGAGTCKHTASQITNVPYGSVGSTNVQSAINELEDEVDSVQSGVSSNTALINSHITDPSAAHAASAISYSNGGSGLSATDVQDAIDELAAAGAGAIEVYEGSDVSSQNQVVRTENLPAVFGNVGANGNKGPDLVYIVAECVTADLGYTAGDVTLLDWQGNQFDEASSADDEGSYITWRENLNDGRTVTWLINYNENNNRGMLAQKGSTASQNFFSVTANSRWVYRLRAYKFM